jgi:putative aldouronate transport system substrate-binding protein
MPGKWYYEEASKQIMPYDISDGMKEALEYIRKLHAERLVVQDWMVIKGSQADAYIDSGKVGMFYAYWSYPNRRQVRLEETSPGVDIVPWKPPVGPDGHIGNLSNAYVASRTFALAATNKHPERAIQFLDYFHSVDGMLFGRFGIEGKNWYWKSGEPTPKTLEEFDARVAANDLVLTDNYQAELKTKQYGFFNLYQMQLRSLLTMGREGRDLDFLTFTLDQPIIKDYADGILSDAKAKYQAGLDTLRDEAFTKIITGDWDLDKFDEYVETWKSEGGNEVIAELNAKYAAITGN